MFLTHCLGRMEIHMNLALLNTVMLLSPSFPTGFLDGDLSHLYVSLPKFNLGLSEIILGIYVMRVYF